MPFDAQGNPNPKSMLAYIALAITLVGSLVSGSMRFQAVETRLGAVELAQGQTSAKLDNISAALSRIEGRLMEQDRVSGDHRK